MIKTYEATVRVLARTRIAIQLSLAEQTLPVIAAQRNAEKLYGKGTNKAHNHNYRGAS